jgi:mRNA interferase HigB
MWIASKSKLRAFWKAHPDAEAPLNAWHRVVERAEWSRPTDVRGTYRDTDPVRDEFVVFNICHNDHRLVVRVDYGRGIVYVWGVYPHREYDRLDLKAYRREDPAGKETAGVVTDADPARR